MKEPIAKSPTEDTHAKSMARLDFYCSTDQLVKQTEYLAHQKAPQPNSANDIPETRNGYKLLKHISKYLNMEKLEFTCNLAKASFLL